MPKLFIIITVFIFILRSDFLCADAMDDFMRSTYSGKISEENPYEANDRFELATDFREEQDKFVIEFDTYDLDYDSIKISIGPQVLAITGRLKMGYEVFYNDQKIYIDTFVKNIFIPDIVDKRRITSSFENGKYIIIMPKITDWYYKKTDGQ